MEPVSQVLEDIAACFKRMENCLKIDTYGGVLLPTKKTYKTTLASDIEYGGCIFGITHGDEVIGVYVLRDFLKLFEQGIIQLEVPFCILLNNIEACKKNVRFIEHDFNRSYGKEKRDDSYELKRNLLAQNVLEKSLYCLDIHQTALPLPINAHFWPTLENATTIDGIKSFDPYGIIVSTPAKDKKVLKQGVSCDNYMQHLGRSSFTVELGARGFSVPQLAQGLHTVLSFVEFVQNATKHKGKALSRAKNYIGDEYVTIGIIESKEGSYLREDLQSFTAFDVGDTIGFDGQGEKIVAKQACYALFPKVKGKVKAASSDPLCYLIAKKS